MNTTQLWLEIAKLAVTTLASSVAAFYAIRIARSQRDIAAQQARTAEEQRRINHAKLNLDLFQERYELFNKVWGFLSHPIDHDNPQPMRGDITNLVPKARFLFGDGIADYILEASKKQIEMSAALLANRQFADLHPLNDEYFKAEMWFLGEAKDCFKRFGPYLDFSAWRRDK